MSRMFALSVMAALIACPAAPRVACAYGPYLDPGAFGQQVDASIADDELTISRTMTRMIYDTEKRVETRTRTVEVGGEKREETVTVEVPVMVPRVETSEVQQKLPLAGVQAFDMQGKRIDGDQLAEALKERRTVLLASRKVPRYYLTIYKPDTLLLVATPQTVFPAPAVVGGAPLLPSTTITPKIDPPRPLPAPAAPGKPDAPPKLDDPKKPDALKTLPAPAIPAGAKPEAPKPLPAPAAVAPPEAPKPLPAPAAVVPQALPVLAPGAALPLAGSSIQEPLPSIARIVDDKLGLRRYVKDVSSETAMREVEQDGVKKLAPFAVEVESITDVERKYPQSVLKIYRADKQPLADDELAKLKDTERCVLVSSDGKDVEARYLKIVKPETLIVIPPPSPLPLMAPGPIGTPSPLKAPMPPAP